MRSHLLHVPTIGQPTGRDRGFASLAAVLQYFGKPYSITDLATIAGATRIDHARLVATAVQTGATVYECSDGGRRSLRNVTELVACGLPVVVGWWSMWAGDTDWSAAWSASERSTRDCAHYSVVRGFTANTLCLMDPQDGASGRTIGPCEIADTEWHEVWYDTDGDHHERVKQWFMALNFDGREFASRFGAGRDHGTRPR